jgi:hypothetical protein
MKLILIFVVLAAAVTFVLAQTKPSLDDTFSANADFVEKFGDKSRSFHGQWWFDYVGRQERFNAATTRGLIDLFRFFNTSKEYEYTVKSDFCKEQPARGRFFGVFNWLSDSSTKSNGQCKSQGKTGTTGNAWQLILKDGKGLDIQLDLCVDLTGKIPYWEELVGSDKGNNWHRGVMFQQYTPGMPPAGTFSLPAKCQSL